ncbi:hypothetical protein SPWS13_3428 [Shewanella putrefaciens]|nr:hypothetical protein SPWS13_3428 [Shewanella putrefaciens]
MTFIKKIKQSLGKTPLANIQRRMANFNLWISLSESDSPITKLHLQLSVSLE